MTDTELIEEARLRFDVATVAFLCDRLEAHLGWRQTALKYLEHRHSCLIDPPPEGGYPGGYEGHPCTCGLDSLLRSDEAPRPLA